MKPHLIDLGDVDCEKCGLLELCNGPVPDEGGDYTILVVGEAPGADEDEQGIPFVGRTGKFLRGVFNDLGYPEDEVTYTNVVRCRPPNNKMKASYIKCCYRGIPIKDNTRLVLLLGNTALKAVLGESGITTWNGIKVERDGIVYVPLFHPAYFLRQGLHSGNPELSAWLDVLDDVLDVLSRGAEGPKDAHYEYVYPLYREAEIYDMCVELMEAPRIAFDTEVSRLNPYDIDNRVLMVSFATAERAWAVPIDHPDDLASISNKSLDMICNVLENHPCVIGHNIKFDLMHCIAMWDCAFKVGGDSMLLSYLHKSVRGVHGLKRLAGLYLGMYDYDKELTEYKRLHPEADPAKGGGYDAIPLDMLLPYAARDASATYLLHDVLYSELSDKQRILYHQLYVPSCEALAHIQCNGMAIDNRVVERYVRVYGRAEALELEYILSDPQVELYVEYRDFENPKKPFAFNPRSWQQKAVILFGTGKCGWLHKPKYKGKWEHYSGPYYGLKPIEYSSPGNPSTRRDLIEVYRDECPLVEHLVMHGMMSKMLGTYIMPIADGTHISSDGRCRTTFNQHVVETGRLSSSKPNFQNIPVPEKEPGTILEYQPIKNMYGHTWTNDPVEDVYEYIPVPPQMVMMDDRLVDLNDGCIMSIDYAGMELRVFASLAGCEAMLDIHRAGLDFHRMVGSMVSGKPPDDITVAERYRYKWTNWTILFGGSAHTLYRLYKIPLDQGEEIIRKYFERFPEVPLYKKECVRFTREHGYIETPFGNRRHLPNIRARERGLKSKAERESVNTPVQGAAGLVTVMALTIIHERMRDAGHKTMMVNTVHDSIVFDVYPGELIEVAGLTIDVMENIVDHAAKYMPDIDMDWLLCPLKADVEIGSHYGCMSKVELFEEG